MKTINDYITALFLGVPETEKTKQLKSDLLANAEDRYEDLKAQGKSENEAIGAVISEFGNIEELLEEMNLKQEYETEHGHELDQITLQEAENYLTIYHRGATLIGLGVMIIILGVAAMSMATAFINEVIGVLFIFLGAAIGVPCFIIAGTSMNQISKQFNDRLIPVSVKNEVRKRKEQFQRSFVLCIVTGVVLCILSVGPLLIFTEAFNSFLDGDFYEMIGLSLMLILVAIGVFFLVFGGVIMGSLNKLITQTYFISDEDKIGPRAKADLNEKKPPLLLIIEKVYWPIVVVCFLVQSFILGNWGISWIIFPVAGVVFGILESILTKE